MMIIEIWVCFEKSWICIMIKINETVVVDVTVIGLSSDDGTLHVIVRLWMLAK